MPLTKDKKKLNKLIQQSDSDDSEHELSYYVNDRIKLMKEVLKVVKPKKIKAMAPSCLKNVETEEINSMLLEELLGISNKRLKYIFKGQNLDENSSSTTSDDEPIDVISLDDISDDDLVINIDDDEDISDNKKRIKKEKHSKCKKKRFKDSVKQEVQVEKPSEKEIGSKKNLMSVLELLELQARARAIKSQLLLENAKTQESLALSKIPTLEENVGSDDEVIIKTAKTEEIVITSSDEGEHEITTNKKETENLENNENKNEPEKSTDNENSEITTNTETTKDPDMVDKIEITQNETTKIKIIENKELTVEKIIIDKDIRETESKGEVMKEDSSQNLDTNQEIEGQDKTKIPDNDCIIQINLSDDEMDSMK